jgi:hypothetical protein
LVTPVFDIAVVVIVFSMIEGVNLREVIAHRSHMVSHYIHHHPDALRVAGRH